MGQYRIAHNNSVPPRPNYWTCPGTHPPPTFLYTTWDHLAGPLLLLASLKYAYSHCVLSSFLSCVRCRCWLIFVFLLFLPFFDFDMDSVCFHPVFPCGDCAVSSVSVSAVTRLAYSYTSIWYICILIRTYADLTFVFLIIPAVEETDNKTVFDQKYYAVVQYATDRMPTVARMPVCPFCLLPWIKPSVVN